MDTLRCKTKMSQNRDTCGNDRFNSFKPLASPFEFHSIHTRFLQESAGIN